MDKQQFDILTFVHSDGWKLVKDHIESKLKDNDNIATIVFEGKDEKSVLLEVMARVHASKMVRDWIGDVESLATQAYENTKAVGDDVPYIKKFASSPASSEDTNVLDY